MKKKKRKERKGEKIYICVILSSANKAQCLFKPHRTFFTSVILPTYCHLPKSRKSPWRSPSATNGRAHTPRASRAWWGIAVCGWIEDPRHFSTFHAPKWFTGIFPFYSMPNLVFGGIVSCEHFYFRPTEWKILVFQINFDSWKFNFLPCGIRILQSQWKWKFTIYSRMAVYACQYVSVCVCERRSWVESSFNW